MAKKLNHIAVLMGYPEQGKSALLKEHIATRLNGGAFAFVQDPDRQFADILPVYDSPGAYAKAQKERRAAGAPIQRGASIATTDETGLTKFILKLAEQNAERPNAPYVFIGYDEAVLLSESSENHVAKDLKNILARRRHLGIAAEILCQELGQLHAIWQRLASSLFAFRTSDEDALKKVAKRFGLNLVELKVRMKAMREEWDYLHIRPGKILPNSSLLAPN